MKNKEKKLNLNKNTLTNLEAGLTNVIGGKGKPPKCQEDPCSCSCSKCTHTIK